MIIQIKHEERPTGGEAAWMFSCFENNLFSISIVITWGRHCKSYEGIHNPVIKVYCITCTLGCQRERWPRCRTWRPATCCSGASSSVPRPTARRGRTRGPSSRRPPQPSPCRWPPADTGRGHAQDVVHDVTFLMSEILNSIFFEIKSICNILHLNLT